MKSCSPCWHRREKRKLFPISAKKFFIRNADGSLFAPLLHRIQYKIKERKNMDCLIILLLLCCFQNNQCPSKTGNRPCQGSGNNSNGNGNGSSCSSGRRSSCGCEAERRESSSCSDTTRNFISFQSQSPCGCENSSN